jgi:hypothetical protein
MTVLLGEADDERGAVSGPLDAESDTAPPTATPDPPASPVPHVDSGSTAA